MSFHLLTTRKLGYAYLAFRSLQLNTTTGSRFMASSNKKKEFLCIMPDRPNVLGLRKQVKGTHYEGVKPLVAAGKLVDGGAIFEKYPEEGKDALFKGSVVVYTGESAEEVREIINNDIYAMSGVWDLEKLQIIPYVAAVREPLL